MAGAGDRLPCTVTRVVDGDTFHCSSGGEDLTIRLTGVDTPELPTPEGEAAKRHVERILPAGKAVELELDVQELDYYHRTLAYVWMPDGKMLNEELVRDGVAAIMTVPPNVKYVDLLRAAARGDRGGD